MVQQELGKQLFQLMGNLKKKRKSHNHICIDKRYEENTEINIIDNLGTTSTLL